MGMIEQMDLLQAIRRSDLEAAQEAVLDGADPGLFCYPRGQNALMASAELGRADIAAWLARRCDPDLPNPSGLRALHAAAAANQAECAAALCLLCDPMAPDAAGNTALACAAAAGHAETVKALAPFCDPSKPNRQGQNALMLAASAGHDECAMLLLERVADLRLEDERGRSAADLAQANGHRKLAGLIRAETEKRDVSQAAPAAKPRALAASRSL